MDKEVKLTIPARKSVSDGILSIVEYVKATELAKGKSEKDLTKAYMFKGSYALATLIKNFYREEVSFAVFDVTDAETGTVQEHACVVYKKRNAEPEYFDINGKKSLADMKKYVARAAKSSMKNVEEKVGYFYAITSTTVPMFNQIVRATLPSKTTNAKAPAAKKPATKTVAKKATAKTPVKAASKPATPVKKAESKPAAKTVVKTAKVATKPVAKKTATKTKKK